jgi:hypothetical protein
VFCSGRVATDELRRRFEEVLKTVPPPWTPPDLELTGEASRGPPSPFPRFRNPERLYSAYLSIAEFNDLETRAAILEDLGTLALPDGLDERTFRHDVGSALLAMDLIAAFDEFVSRPRYFGEMAEWLRSSGVLAEQGAEDRKLYLQTLIRWLRYFVPGRVTPETNTRRVPTWMKNRTCRSTNPLRVALRTERKSQAHRVAVCGRTNSSHVPSPRLGPGSRPAPRSMVATVVLLTLRMPRFFRLSEYSRVPPPGLTGDLQDQLADLHLGWTEASNIANP